MIKKIFFKLKKVGFKKTFYDLMNYLFKNFNYSLKFILKSVSLRNFYDLLTIRNFNKNKYVNVVLCIDTEGPKSEFIKDQNMLWHDLNKRLSMLMSESFRNKYKDSFGNNLTLNWFIMDHSGFNENPYNVNMGYGTVFKNYQNLFKKFPNIKDGVYWHYHHPRNDGKFSPEYYWNSNWNDNKEYYNILNHRIIDFNFFPTVYRAGGTIERNESSNWLEKWIPFDFSNRAPYSTKDKYKWEKALSNWEVYNPNKEDYQIKGDIKRTIARCLSIDDPKEFNLKEIIKAFKETYKGNKVILSFFSHDFNNKLFKRINYLYSSLKLVSQITGIKFKFNNSLNAMQETLNYNKINKLNIKIIKKDDYISINSNNELFGDHPYIVTLNKNNNYKNYKSIKERNGWKFKFDKNVKKIGVAAVDIYGQSYIKVLKI